MIHVIANENRHLYQPQLLEHHRIRHQFYIEERRWDGIESRDGGEYDQFDNDDTIYCLSIEDGRVLGGTRLYPTVKPNLLSSVWPELADVRGIPSGPNLYEWTRLFAIRERREGRYGGAVLGEIFAGSLEFCLEEGISALTCIFEAWWLPRMQQHGWDLKPLGLPTLIKGEWWVAALIPVDAEMVRSTRAYYHVEKPVLVRNGLTSVRRAKVA
jgi:acyl-homoserine lactone synthase